MSANLFWKRKTDYPFLIMSHRGFWGGNVIENSIQSSILAYQAGADIVEVDVCRTIDGIYYLFHDGNEPKLLGIEQNFKELTSEKVEKMSVLNSIGTDSGYRITKFSEFLEWLPEGKLVNIDRSWEYWDDTEFFDCINSSSKKEHLVFKSPVNKKMIRSFINHADRLNYIPIIHSLEEAAWVLEQKKLNTIGLELIIKAKDSELLEDKWLQSLNSNQLLTLINSEHLGHEYNLLGGLTDHTAIFNNNDWSPITSLGMGIIQTDWPNFLSQYREKMGD